MSLGIYGSSGTPQLYTMATTRKLNLIYFDGQSASLTAFGTLDSQMALLQDEVPSNPSEKLVYDENQRAKDLCALIRPLKLDGVVRMNTGFEVMLCNYVQAGVRQLYSSNVTVPGNEQREADPALPQDPNREPPLGFGNAYAAQNSWEWIRSGTWHYGTSQADAGSKMESRVELDLCGFMSYYDPSLRSLSGHHEGGFKDPDKFQNGWGLRRGHRLLGISKEDIFTVKTWLRKITNAHAFPARRRCSGVNWQTLTATITNQHRTRAREILAAMKNIVPTIENVRPIIKKVHELSHAILYSYLQYPSAANISLADSKNLTISRCSSVYTEYIEQSTLNEFEVLIKESIRIVMRELCNWEWDLFEWSERHTTDLLDPRAKPFSDRLALVEEFERIAERASSTMQWIGWDDWHDCERKCRPDVGLIPTTHCLAWLLIPFQQELCYIPMWPVIYAPGKHQGGIYADDTYTEEEISEFWRPKCLSRSQFDKGGGRAREPSHQLPGVPT